MTFRYIQTINKKKFSKLVQQSYEIISFSLIFRKIMYVANDYINNQITNIVTKLQFKMWTINFVCENSLEFTFQIFKCGWISEKDQFNTLF